MVRRRRNLLLSAPNRALMHLSVRRDWEPPVIQIRCGGPATTIASWPSLFRDEPKPPQKIKSSSARLRHRCTTDLKWGQFFMTSRLRQRIEEVVETLPKHPAIRLIAMLLAAFVAIATAVKGYREIFPPEPQLRASEPALVSSPSSAPPLAPTIEEPHYASLWSCIPPGWRGGVTDFDRTRPSQRQLDGSLLFWSSNGFAQAPNCLAILLRAGGSPDSALPTDELGYGSGPALHSALNQKRWGNALILLTAGANPNLETTYHPDSPNGKTALDMAYESMGASEIKDAIRARGGVSKYEKHAQ